MLDITLGGCAPAPLASYLKALGVFRLIAEQGDPNVQGWWQNDEFWIRSGFDSLTLERFFLETYSPSPVLAPWNGGSGFYYQEEKLKDKDPKTGKRLKTGLRNQATEATRTVDRVAQSSADRFDALRRCISFSKAFLSDRQLNQAPERGEAKTDFIAEYRNSCPDRFLSWMDAACVLTGEDPSYPPLLGSGGNDGNLDFTNNFMQRLTELIHPDTGDTGPQAKHWLKAALFGAAVSGLTDAAIGQFAPGSAGGPNASSGFEGDALVNPWDFVFMIEGAILFAAAVTRKHQATGPGSLSYPFTVRQTGSGSGAGALADEAQARPEMWLPLWGNPTGGYELRALFSEGRLTLGRRAARDGLDVVRALSRFGSDRGIYAFQRYGFLKRSGKAYLATPLNRVRVSRNPTADLVDQIDHWLLRFRRVARNKDRPGRVAMLVRRLENAIFDMAREGTPRRVQAVLVALGQVQRYLANSFSRREECPPIPRLSPDWVVKADDGTAEFRIAAALASLRGTLADRHTDEVSGQLRPCLPMSAHIAPVNHIDVNQWDENSRLVSWSDAPLEPNLYAALQRRLLYSERNQLADKPLLGCPLADLRAITAFIYQELDDNRIVDLIPGLSLARAPASLPGERSKHAVLPGAYLLFKPLFSPDRDLRAAELLADEQALNLPPGLPRLIYGSRIDGTRGAASIALRSLRACGLVTPFDAGHAAQVNGARLLAALLLPVSYLDLRYITARTRSTSSKDVASSV